VPDAVVTLSGFAELDQALAELPKATAKNVLRRIARGALEPMADMAAARAPHRTGRLAYSIAISEKRTPRAQWQNTTTGRTVWSAGGFRASASSGITMAMGPAGGLGTLFYASFDEFGTLDTPAFGFMRSAWDTGADAALEYIRLNLSIEIEKSALRYARRQAKLAAA
jgi:HK97 gp10 family phage protein